MTQRARSRYAAIKRTSCPSTQKLHGHVDIATEASTLATLVVACAARPATAVTHLAELDSTENGRAASRVLTRAGLVWSSACEAASYDEGPADLHILRIPTVWHMCRQTERAFFFASVAVDLRSAKHSCEMHTLPNEKEEVVPNSLTAV